MGNSFNVQSRHTKHVNKKKTKDTLHSEDDQKYLIVTDVSMNMSKRIQVIHVDEKGGKGLKGPQEGGQGN